jgi:hypothetical protein
MAGLARLVGSRLCATCQKWLDVGGLRLSLCLAGGICVSKHIPAKYIPQGMNVWPLTRHNPASARLASLCLLRPALKCFRLHIFVPRPTANSIIFAKRLNRNNAFPSASVTANPSTIFGSHQIISCPVELLACEQAGPGQNRLSRPKLPGVSKRQGLWRGW